MDLRNKIICMDCVDGMKLIDDNSVDLVVTSPPYNVGIEYDTHVDNMPWDDYYKWSDVWMREVHRILKPDGKFCLNHYLSFGRGGERHSPLMDLNCIAVNDVGFKHHGLALWWDITRTKYTAWGSWMSASAPYINSPVEGILILYKERWKKDTKGESTISRNEFIESCSGIWKIKPEANEYTKANFPPALPRRCISLFTYRHDYVVDPFGGAGTTAIAAKTTGRDFTLFEISENYCEIARKRFSRYNNADLFEFQ